MCYMVTGVTNQYSTREMLAEVGQATCSLWTTPTNTCTKSSVFVFLFFFYTKCWIRVEANLLFTQVKGFFGSLTEETGSEMRCIRQTYETIEDNIRWMDTHLPLLQAWLDKRSRRPVHEDL